MSRYFVPRSSCPHRTLALRRRRCLRRAVDIRCELRSELWDGAVHLCAHDLSPRGMWIETDLPLDEGDEVLASFSPPGSCVRLNALCVVSRVALFRRADDGLPSGMGLSFTDLSRHDRGRLSRSLIGIPPPLPLEVRMRQPLTVTQRVWPARAKLAPRALPSVLDPALARSA